MYERIWNYVKFFTRIVVWLSDNLDTSWHIYLVDGKIKHCHTELQQVFPKGPAPLTYTVRLWKELGALDVLGIQEQPNLAHNLNSFGSFQTKLDFMLQSTFAK